MCRYVHSFHFHNFLSHSVFLFFHFCFFVGFRFFCAQTNQNDSISSDINECSEGIDGCNRKTQLCLNTLGGYNCQEKIGDKCFPGLKYNVETKLCEGAERLSLIFFLRCAGLIDFHFGLAQINFISFDSQLNFCLFNQFQISTNVNSIPNHVTTDISVSTRSVRLNAFRSTRNQSMNNTPFSSLMNTCPNTLERKYEKLMSGKQHKDEKKDGKSKLSVMLE